jgi:hypothetical protein
MRRLVLILTALALAALAPAELATATESDALARLQQLAQRTTDLPKGPYQSSCQCQISGGIFLQCFCANLNARMFQTNMDVRTCPAPKEIKNCDGTLRCKEKAEEC